MSDYKLPIPEHLLKRARQIAETVKQPVGTVLLNHLSGALDDPIASLPEAERHELTALRYLSDDTLATIAAETMPTHKQARQQALMDANTHGRITPREHDELTALVEAGQQLMVRKAQAMVILNERRASAPARAATDPDDNGQA